MKDGSSGHEPNQTLGIFICDLFVGLTLYRAFYTNGGSVFSKPWWLPRPHEVWVGVRIGPMPPPLCRTPTHLLLQWGEQQMMGLQFSQLLEKIPGHCQPPGGADGSSPWSGWEPHGTDTFSF